MIRSLFIFFFQVTSPTHPLLFLRLSTPCPTTFSTSLPPLPTYTFPHPIHPPRLVFYESLLTSFFSYSPVTGIFLFSLISSTSSSSFLVLQLLFSLHPLIISSENLSLSSLTRPMTDDSTSLPQSILLLLFHFLFPFPPPFLPLLTINLHFVAPTIFNFFFHSLHILHQFIPSPPLHYLFFSFVVLSDHFFIPPTPSPHL